MGILGGYIHRLGIVKLGGLPTKLGFIPDYMTFESHVTLNSALKTGNTHVRGGVCNHSAGNWGADVNTDLNTFSCLAPKDMKIRYIELRVVTGGAETEYYFSVNHDTVSNTLINVPLSTTGTFSNDSEHSVSQGGVIGTMFKRVLGGTTGGQQNSVGCYAFTYDD